MEKVQRNYYLLIYIFILVITFITTALCFLSNNMPVLLMLISLIIIMAGIYFVWLKKLSKRILYFNNILNILAANILAYFLIHYLINSQSTIIGMILGIVVMDVFSFTKRGKNTLNAKLSGNINTMARLSVCLPIPKKPGLQQIIGVGDLLYYALITMYYIKSGRTSAAGIHAAMIILIGQLVNIIAILVIKRIQKEQYKGFPATLFPGIFIIIATVFRFI
jgi:hypothetical protein